jgi:RNA polymerase sigma factor (TIGR02999 family)
MTNEPTKSQLVTRELAALDRGDEHAPERLLPLVYDELRQLAGRYLSREAVGHSLQPTELVHEAFVRLSQGAEIDLNGRTHFYAIGARAMRRILVDHARSKKRDKRGGGRKKLSLEEGLTLTTNSDEDVLAVEELMEDLREQDPRLAQIVELRFYGNMTVPEVAVAMGMSTRWVEKQWTLIKAWVRGQLGEDESA